MTNPASALQRLIFERLVATSQVTALVSATSIFDRAGRPEVFPCVILGEAQAIFSDRYETFFETVHADLHIWTAEPGFTLVRSITDAVRSALWDRSAWTVEGHQCHALIVEGEQTFRDPAGLHSHAVLSIKAILQQRAAA